MYLKIIYKNKEVSNLHNLDFRVLKQISDWWINKEDEPTLIIESDTLSTKFIRENILNIERRINTNNNTKNRNGMLN